MTVVELKTIPLYFLFIINGLSGLTMVTDVMTLLRMLALPPARAVAIGEGQGAAQGAGDEVEGLVVVTADGRALVPGEDIAALVEDVEGTAAMSAAVPAAGLAEVVEKGRHGKAPGRERVRVGAHVFIYFDGVLREPAALLVMGVASAGIVARRVEVIDDGVRSRTAQVAEDRDDTLSVFCHVLSVHAILYYPGTAIIAGHIKDSHNHPFRRSGGSFFKKQ